MSESFTAAVSGGRSGLSDLMMTAASVESDGYVVPGSKPDTLIRQTELGKLYSTLVAPSQPSLKANLRTLSNQAGKYSWRAWVNDDPYSALDASLVVLSSTALEAAAKETACSQEGIWSVRRAFPRS